MTAGIIGFIVGAVIGAIAGIVIAGLVTSNIYEDKP